MSRSFFRLPSRSRMFVYLCATVGELQSRGPWVASAYYRNPTSGAFQDGWLRYANAAATVFYSWLRSLARCSTGDMACIDSEGYVKIADRAKDGAALSPL
jgi:fatty-acyl-CoA synthase